MVTRTNRIAALIMGLLFIFGPSAASALDPAPKCESGKLKEAGKYAACRLKTASVAVKKGITPDYSKCASKFGAQWNKLQAKAGPSVCPTWGDGAAMDARIIEDTAAITTLLAGGTVAECGNGVVEPGEECDVGNLNGQTCASLGFDGGGTLGCALGCVFDSSWCGLRVFSTSSVYQGNLGGLAGADALCQAEANAAGLLGTYKAWLSDNTGHPLTRFSHGTRPYRYHRSFASDYPLVALSWDDLLFDSNVYRAIFYDAAGDGVTYFENWSSTDPHLAQLVGHKTCNNWTDDTATYGAEVGRNQGYTDSRWSYDPAANHTCDEWHGLYCFQQ